MDSPKLSSQEDAALVVALLVALAQRAAEDGPLIIGSGLTRDEFNALAALLDKEVN